jgi:N-acetyl sugar amidotransferase
MDTSDPRIEFDDEGVCNHCRRNATHPRADLLTGETARVRLERLVGTIKASGNGRKYDCVVGVSGGVDSTYVAYVSRRLGLRPLAVHFDNGWDSEIAARNIENLVKRLDIDLRTWVVEWEEFRALQLAFLRAGVANLDAPTDHGIWAAVYAIAAGMGIRYVLSGHNIATEGVMPAHWCYTAKDLRQIEGIYRTFGDRSLALRSYPKLGFLRSLYCIYVRGIRRVPILDYVGYVKTDAMATISRELDWRDYGGKHYENVFTRFFHGYMLPARFGYDMRKAHLSALICSGQLSRERALEILAANDYLRGQVLEDRAYVLAKLGLSEREFETMLAAPRRHHRDFPSLYLLYENVPLITGVLKSMGVRYK